MGCIMKALVGYTGFVGSNICAHGTFDGLYNSKNIESAYGSSPDLLIYSGLRAEKYLANNDPEADLEQIKIAEANISRIAPKKLVLISTIDVFKNPVGVDENTAIDTEGLHAYGYNRYLLETWVRENYPDALIVRLPGLFGINIKKNFIYDYMNVIPFMLKEDKFMELSNREPALKACYVKLDNGFYKSVIDESSKLQMKEVFKSLGFTALNFTDSRSNYQFYNLANLNNDIEIALEASVKLWHPATEPVNSGELYKYLSGNEFINELKGEPANYDYKTIHDSLFGGKNGYICDKVSVMEDIRRFIDQ